MSRSLKCIMVMLICIILINIAARVNDFVRLPIGLGLLLLVIAIVLGCASIAYAIKDE